MNLFPKYQKIKKILINNNKIIKNFSFLSLLQIFNIIAPLITYPYLIRVLGSENYGLIIYIQSLVTFLAIFVGFGFNIIGTKEVSIHRDSISKTSEIVSAILTIKLYLFIIVVCILSVLINFVPIFQNNKLLVFFTLWMCINEIIFPIWYFQGKEDMKYITYITIVSKLFVVGFILVIIKKPDDYIYVPLIYGLGAIISGIISLYIIFFIHKIKIYRPKIKIIYFYFNEAKPFFLSNMLVSFREKSSLLIIGSVLTMSEVSYYDLAQKITELFRLPFITIKDVVFPSIAKSGNYLKLNRLYYLSLILAIFTLFIVFIFTPLIVNILGGSSMIEAVEVTRVLVFMIPLSVMSMYFGVSIIVFGTKKSYRNSIILSFVTYSILILVFLLSNNLTFYTVLISSFTSTLFEIFYRNHHIKKINYNEITF